MSHEKSLLQQVAEAQESAFIAGFRWNEEGSSDQQVIDWLVDEANEFLEAETERDRTEELGDIFMFVVRLGWRNGLNCDLAIGRALDKFNQRIAIIQDMAQTRYHCPLDQVPAADVRELWSAAKSELRQRQDAAAG